MTRLTIFLLALIFVAVSSMDTGKDFSLRAHRKLDEQAEYYEAAADDAAADDAAAEEEEADDAAADDAAADDAVADDAAADDAAADDATADDATDDDSSGSSVGDKFKQYQSEYTNKVNNNLPEGYSVTENQLLYIVSGLLAFVFFTMMCMCSGGSKDEDDYIRSDLLKNQNGVSA